MPEIAKQFAADGLEPAASTPERFPALPSGSLTQHDIVMVEAE